MQQRDRSPVHKLWFVCIFSIVRSASGLICMNPCYFCHRSLLSLCVHASTVSLSLYLSTSITFPLASQGNWVLHVIAPWENQIGTSRFLWVCVLCLPQTPIQSFFSNVLWLTCDVKRHLWSPWSLPRAEACHCWTHKCYTHRYKCGGCSEV